MARARNPVNHQVRSPLRIAVLSLAFAVVTCGRGWTSDEPVLVFAAASTSDALAEIAKAYTAETKVEVTLSFAASSTLAKQIENGAPADLILSADEQWMDDLDQHHALRAGSRANLLANHLVLVAPKGKAPSPAIQVASGFDIAKAWNGRLAIADPSHVPAGIYAQAAFTELGWWDAVKDRLAPTLDVRAALRLVETGETGLGVVYATDAKTSDRIEVVALLPDDARQPIRYPVALTMNAKPRAQAFLDYLRDERASAIFTRLGFEMAPLVAPATTPAAKAPPPRANTPADPRAAH